MARYIPPALRSKQASTTEETPVERRPEDGYTIEEICHQFDYTSTPGTLNGGEHLLFILLFSDQHPQWPSKIFCKSNLHLLDPNPASNSSIGADLALPLPIETSIEKLDSSAKPVPVFTQDRGLQTRIHSNRETHFVFHGMYAISSVDYLQPRSDALVNMLEIKFQGGKQRSPKGWMESLTMKWAVVELQSHDLNLNPMVPLKPIRRKGVTEMLEEMRLKKVSASVTKEKQDEGVSTQKGGALAQAAEA